jgi:hypothetical protein
VQNALLGGETFGLPRGEAIGATAADWPKGGNGREVVNIRSTPVGNPREGQALLVTDDPSCARVAVGDSLELRRIAAERGKLLALASGLSDKQIADRL